MSNKEQLRDAEHYIKQGDGYFDHAEKMIQKIPDKDLHKKISEVRQKTEEVKKYIEKVLEK